LKPEWAGVKALEKFKWLITRLQYKDWPGARQTRAELQEYLDQIDQAIEEGNPPEPDESG